MLFLIYVNDITEQLLCLTRLFADDSSLFTSATDIHDIEGIINHDLIIISQWAKQWLVKFNPNKTEAILFSLRQLNLLPNLVFENVKINLVDQHKHLGLTFRANGKWNEHVENILSSASKIIGIMRKLKYSFSKKSIKSKFIFRMFDQSLSIHLLFGTIAQSNKPIHWKKCKTKPLGLLLDLPDQFL